MLNKLKDDKASAAKKLNKEGVLINEDLVVQLKKFLGLKFEFGLKKIV